MGTMMLKPCPFCGSEEISISGRWSCKNRMWFVFAQCEVCKASSKAFPSSRNGNADEDEILNEYVFSEAERSWNRRAC